MAPSCVAIKHFHAVPSLGVMPLRSDDDIQCHLPVLNVYQAVDLYALGS